MRWSDFNLNWGRPLKSILAIFDKKKLTLLYFRTSGIFNCLIGKQSWYRPNLKS